MKRLLALLLAASCLTAVGQEIGCWYEMADNYLPNSVGTLEDCEFFGGTHTGVDTIFTFDLVCEGGGEMIYSPDYDYNNVFDAGNEEVLWELTLNEMLVNNGFPHVKVLDWGIHVVEASTCWSYNSPLVFTQLTEGELNCPSCSGLAERSFVEFIVVTSSTSPCDFIDAGLQSVLCAGCMDQDAINFRPEAIIDDGTCVYPSGSCGEGTAWDPMSQTCIVDESACGWQPDGNGDGLVGLTDLLDLLTVYGDTDYDQDGIWDSADDCVGEYDECGVCNGSGASIPIIESIEILYDSVYAEQIDDWLVFEVGVDTTYQYVCETIEGCTDSTADNYDPNANIDDGSCWNCGQSFELFGYSYGTVLIGSQCWFTENLRSTRYLNGESIQNFATTGWNNGAASGATLVYGSDSVSVAYCYDDVPEFDACDEIVALEEFGRLYNFYTILDDRKICPSGWHVPSDADWQILEIELGMSETDVHSTSWRGEIAPSLKSTSTYGNNGNGLNTSGFNGKAHGSASFNGSGVMYSWAGDFPVWWSSTPAPAEFDPNPQAWCRGLDDYEDGVWRDGYDYDYLRAIRCIKD